MTENEKKLKAKLAKKTERIKKLLSDNKRLREKNCSVEETENNYWEERHRMLELNRNLKKLIPKKYYKVEWTGTSKIPVIETIGAYSAEILVQELSEEYKQFKLISITETAV